MKLADISLFESLMGNRQNQCSIHNSAASQLMLDYAKALQSVRLCKKYIKDMQKVDGEEEYVPSTMIGNMYQLKEKCEDELSAIEEQLVSQVTSESLDPWDRKTFTKLPKEAQEALRDVLEDDVIKRAMELQAEALEEINSSADSEDSEPEPEPQKEKVSETKVEPEEELDLDLGGEGESDQDDGFGLDVSSTEG